ncbi:SgcJ/EcaC family oxidoreductase [Pantoea sp. Ap-967]|uniref:SgcJ/EcaC family oxidoreductase n=1 Tax=Pantoea sp. Ap-967 TaxID=2608362 RepID=UPI00141ECCF1|nr:SgcJ/EcaC family oxidoreductase [Pantoea sp. Ap-967]NIE77269.1 SgcJ/EcaC family oxidoreductase [Pantoea sp. Ap-967]
MPRLPFMLPLMLASCFSLPAVAASAATCDTPSDAQVLALFGEWNNRLQVGDAAKVAELYQDGALLLPTLSATPRLTREAHIDYFKGFLRDRPAGALDETQVFSGCDQATLAGLYTFTFAATGKQVPARFTFNYRKVGGEWLITHHHSSLQPSS